MVPAQTAVPGAKELCHVLHVCLGELVTIKWVYIWYITRFIIVASFKFLNAKFTAGSPIFCKIGHAGY